MCSTPICKVTKLDKELLSELYYTQYDKMCTIPICKVAKLDKG